MFLFCSISENAVVKKAVGASSESFEGEGTGLVMRLRPGLVSMMLDDNHRRRLWIMSILSLSARG
jgi:hypothetical protein